MIDLGRALFNVKNYKEAIRMLSDVIKLNPKLIYEKSDLFVIIGNSYYHIGKTKEAREYRGKVYNRFPETELNHEYLTNVPAMRFSMHHQEQYLS